MRRNASRAAIRRETSCDIASRYNMPRRDFRTHDGCRGIACRTLRIAPFLGSQVIKESTVRTNGMIGRHFLHSCVGNFRMTSRKRSVYRIDMRAERASISERHGMTVVLSIESSSVM